MARRLRDWDQGRHIISTEFCNDQAPCIDTLWRSPEIEYAQTGGYSFGRGLVTVLSRYARTMQYGKPLIIEEYGGHAQGGSAPWIAHELHDGPWIGWMLRLSAAPMPWWWNLAFHYRLENRHRRFADFIEGEDLRHAKWTHATLAVAGAPALQALTRLSPERGYAWVFAPKISNFNIREREYWKMARAGETIYAQIIGAFDALAEEPGDLFPPVTESSIRLDGRGLTPGTWRAECWDTWSDATPISVEFIIAADGSGTLILPRLTRDCAVKLIKLP
jgi:hypothetical protein